MNFPRNRLRFTRTHDGSTSATGWLELDVKGLDLEGVSKITIELAEVDRLRHGGDQQDEALKRARDLLGG